MKILIKVTKEILEKSKMCGTASAYAIVRNCAISLAIRDIFPRSITESGEIQLILKEKLESVIILGRAFDDDIEFKIPLPVEARDFISVFDALDDDPEARTLLAPISFEIDVPDSVIEQIGIEEAKAIIEKSETLELV